MEEEVRALLAALNYPVAWGRLGQGTALPRIALYNVSGVDDMHVNGRSGWIAGRVQVDVFAATYAQAATAKRAVIDALSGYQGTAVMGARLISVRDTADEAGGDVLQRVSLDFAVEYRA